MNIEETKAAIAVMQAYVDGKEIEYQRRDSGDGWCLLPKRGLSPIWNWLEIEYRVRVTKPSINWDHVAPEVVAIATDGDGRSYCYENIPILMYDSGVWVSDGENGRASIAEHFASYAPGTCDWKDSRVIRPGYEGEKP